MNMITINLNGKEIKTEPGKTILDLANEQGIEIPTLCHDEELKPFGSCWVCAVKVEGRRGFVTACGTEIMDGMKILTDSSDVRDARKTALELLLSDHYADCLAPCTVACPDQVDIQTYVSLIANGQYQEAVKVIKEKLPMPLSIGRVCPAFCEAECRRTIIDEPVAIRQLKRHAADYDLALDHSYVPPRGESKGKKIAIIGAGPSGLTCGYYLSNQGYEVKCFEASPQAGGWLRYGIPQYRLPKEILDSEIELMCANGMEIQYNIYIGRDISVERLSKDYDAVYMAVGAQQAVPMRTKGSDLDGVLLGVDFLKDFALGKQLDLGKKVAIVGGGNTAIDCARTAVRMGADVTLIYRRTRKEMPAEAYEVDAAEEEGVKFHFLTNPAEMFGLGGKLKTVKFEIMELGEPDESGRRRPKPTGRFFEDDYETVIAAISQAPDVGFLAEAENKVAGKEWKLTRWMTAECDEATMYWSDNVFAGGDFRRGAATAIEAIADGRLASESIHNYLQGNMMRGISRFDSKKEKKLADIDPRQYERYEKRERINMPELEADYRRTNLDEVENDYDHEQAMEEAGRCIECGCHVNETCALRKYATDYEVDAYTYAGAKNKHPIDETHPFILRDANRCVKCGRCVRICGEVQGAGVLGYIWRGFQSYVAPEFGESLNLTACEECGKCIAVCPTGALMPRNVHYKLNPHKPERTIVQSCGQCGTGCQIEISLTGDRVTIVNAAEGAFNGRNLCFRGRFGWQIYDDEARVKSTSINIENHWESVSSCSIPQIIKEKSAKAMAKKIFIHPTTTLEELAMLQQVADRMKAGLYSLTLSSDISDSIIVDDLAGIDAIEQADAYYVVGEISQTLRTLLRLKQREGKKLWLINDEDNRFNEFADIHVKYDPETALLHTLECYTSTPRCKPNCLDFTENTLFIYNRDNISGKAAKLVWKLAGSVQKDIRKKVYVTSNYSNTLGLVTAGITCGKVEEGDFVVLYGEDSSREIYEKAAGVICLHTHIDEPYADALIPKPTFQEIKGTAIGDGYRTLFFSNPRNSKYFEKLIKIFIDSGLLPAGVSPEYYQQNIKNDYSLRKVKPLAGLLKDEKFEHQPRRSKILEKRLDILKAVK
jgi:formate dehydrogenase major subunit